MCSLTSCLNLISPISLMSCVHINVISICVPVSECEWVALCVYSCVALAIGDVKIVLCCFLLWVVFSFVCHYIGVYFYARVWCWMDGANEWYKTVQSVCVIVHEESCVKVHRWRRDAQATTQLVILELLLSVTMLMWQCRNSGCRFSSGLLLFNKQTTAFNCDWPWTSCLLGI